MELQILFALVGGIVNLFLAILVIYKNRHNPVHQIFCFLSIILACFNFFLFHYYSRLFDIFWKRMVYLNASIMPAIAYHFFITLIDKNNGINKKIMWSGYFAGTIFLTSVLTPVFESYNRIWTLIFIFVMFPYAIYGAYLLFQTARTTNLPMERLRLNYLIYGSLAITFTGGIDLIYGLHLSSIANTFYSLLAGYSIIKHRLLDITILTSKLVTIIVMAVVISGIFLFSIFFIGKPFNVLYFSILISTIFTIIIYQPIKNEVINFIEQHIFKSKFAYQHAIYEFSHNMNSFLEENVLAQKLVNLIGENMDFSNVAIWSKENEIYNIKKSQSQINCKDIITEDSCVIQAIKKYNIIFKEDLLRFLKYEDLSGDEKDVIKSTTNTMDELKLETIFPIARNNIILGFIGFSKKENNAFLYSNDIKMLQMLADQYAACLLNIQLQQELYRHKEMALLGRLASGIAHEVKNPLGSMKGAAQYIREELKEKNMKTEFADIIIEEADRLNSLIMEFLQFARPLKIEKRDADINSLLSQILKIIIKEDRFKNIKFIQNFANSLPVIKADNNQIKQVLYNLIINAGEASLDNGVVEINTLSDFYNIYVTIKDNGKGISPEVLPNIFEPFFTTKKNGTGLGLSIAKQIISGHNGTIRVESIPCDTKFTISLAI